MIKYRVSHTEHKKNHCYRGIQLLIDKEAFVTWFMENDFEGASVDRIDATKDYTLDNIQLIPLADNIRKAKTKAVDGYCECYRCKTVKPLEFFAVNKHRANGHTTICKECDSKRKV